MPPGKTPVRVVKLLDAGAIHASLDIEDEISANQTSMERYANVPMSFADAYLVPDGGKNGPADPHARRQFYDLLNAARPGAGFDRTRHRAALHEP